MPSTGSLLAHGSIIRRRLALMCAALASVLALLTLMAAADAGAATVKRAQHTGTAAAAAHLNMPKSASGLFPTTWEVKFRNGYAKHIDVAVAKWNPDKCGGEGGNWQVQGWYGLEPGETKSLISSSSRYAGYYAEAVDGAKWSGDYGPAYVTDAPFDSCLKIGSTAAYTVGLKSIEMPDISFPTTRYLKTITLA